MFIVFPGQGEMDGMSTPTPPGSGRQSARHRREFARTEALDQVDKEAAAARKRSRSRAVADLDDDDRGGKKQRTAALLLVPTAATLEQGTDFVHGVLQMPAAQASVSKERKDGAVHLPAPAAQHELAMATPAERAVVAAAPVVVSSTAALATLTPRDALANLYAPWLDRLTGIVIADGRRTARLVDVNAGQIEPNKPPVTSASFQQARTDAADTRDERYRQYYASGNDTEPDPSLPFGLPRPGDYPSLVALLSDIDPAYRKRELLVEQAALVLPRVQVEQVTRTYIEPFLTPYNVEQSADEEWPPCMLHDQCICSRLAVQEGVPRRGYIAPRFFRPSELRAWREKHRTEPGPCFLDLLYAWTMRVYHTLMQRHVASEPINSFSVICGPGEFAREVMLPIEVDGYPTGIDGHVPVFNTARLQYVQRQIRSAASTNNAASYSCISLLHMDFRLSLSQTNACLGVRKLRALGGSAAQVAVPRMLLLAPTLAVVADDAADEGLAATTRAWRHFLAAVPSIVLADRALAGRQGVALAALQREQSAADVPAVWLRHYYYDASLSLTQHVHTAPNAGESWWPLVDVCFCSFEDTVTTLLAAQEWRHAARVFADAAEADPALALHYAGVGGWHTPEAGKTDILWLAMRVRIALALRLSTRGHDDPDAPRGRILRDYMLRLFVDTHLAMLGQGEHDDAWWLPQRLLDVYPHALRVICADELPDLAQTLWTTNIWYDSGKKSQRGFMHVLTHVLGKLMNQACQGRSFDTILASEMHAYPTLAVVVCLMLTCALLGNIRTSQRPLVGLLARLRVMTAFMPSPGTMQPVQTWVYRYPLLAMALMRDCFLYVLECEAAFDALSSTSLRWTRFKALARQLAGDVREMIVAGMLCDPDGFVDHRQWHDLEERAGQWHEYSKAQNVKFRKGNDVDIMLRKMTSIEKTLVFDLPDIYAWMRAHGRLDALRAYAWHSARTIRRPDFEGVVPAPRRVLPVAMLKAFGMHEANYELLRRWLHDYNDYAIRDHGYCKVVHAIHANAPRDLVLLKCYLRLVEYYLGDGVMCLSYEHTRAQIGALRDDLAIEPWAATPDLLGTALLCEGCQQWASPVVTPSVALLGSDCDISLVKPLVPQPPRIASGRAGCVEHARLHPTDGKLYCKRAVIGANTSDAIERLIEKSVQEKMAEGNGTSQALNDLVRPLLGSFTCQRPLMAIHMAGIYKRVQHTLYGRCVYCGRLCEVHAVNMTNDGLSCGDHAEPCGVEYPRHHRLWQHLSVTPRDPPPRIVRTQCSAHAGMSGRLCSQPACVALPVYDAMYRVRVAHLCSWHLRCLRTLLPGQEAAMHAAEDGTGLPPLAQFDVDRMLRHK